MIIRTSVITIINDYWCGILSKKTSATSNKVTNTFKY